MSSLKSTVSAVMRNFMKVTTGHILGVYLGYKCFSAVPFHSHGKVEPRPGVVMVLQTRQNQIQILPVHATLFSLETCDFIQWNNIQISYHIRNVWQVSGMFISVPSVCHFMQNMSKNLRFGVISAERSSLLHFRSTEVRHWHCFRTQLMIDRVHLHHVGGLQFKWLTTAQ